MLETLSALTSPDTKAAYEKLKAMISESQKSNIYYCMFDAFLDLVSSEKSYERVRGFKLCCAQAKWDTEGRLEESLPDLMKLLSDEKPTAVRQALSALLYVLKERPELRPLIVRYVEDMDLSGYKDSMRPLIEKDRALILS